MQDTALSAKIAALNDAARRNVMSYLTSAGVISLEPSIVGDIYTAVRNFSRFTEDNDPYGEHDFADNIMIGILYNSRIFFVASIPFTSGIITSIIIR